MAVNRYTTVGHVKHHRQLTDIAPSVLYVSRGNSMKNNHQVSTDRGDQWSTKLENMAADVQLSVLGLYID